MRFPHEHIIKSSSTWCRHDGYWTLVFFSSINSTLSMFIIVWHDSELNIVFFFGRSLRIQILFESILIFSMTSVFASLSTASVCEIVSRTSSFLRTESLSMSEVICPSCQGSVVTSVESFNSSCTSVQYSFPTFVFTRRGTSVHEEEECCCCWLRLFFFNVSLDVGLGVSCLSKSTRYPFWDVTRSIQSPGIVAWVMIANDFVCQNSNPWLYAFDNRTRYTVFWLSFHLVT